MLMRLDNYSAFQCPNDLPHALCKGPACPWFRFVKTEVFEDSDLFCCSSSTFSERIEDLEPKSAEERYDYQRRLAEERADKDN